MSRLLLMCILVWAAMASPGLAGVVSAEVREKGPWVAQKSFGKGGSYEYLAGVVHYEIDPASDEAADIADIHLAPVNARGMVEYSGPFLILRPTDPGRANGVTVVDIANRGDGSASNVLFAVDSLDLQHPRTAKVWDSSPFDLGYSFAWVGWQAGMGPDKFGLTVPVGSGRGPVRFNLVPEGAQIGSHSVSLAPDSGGYCAAGLDQSHAALRIRTRLDQPGVLVPAHEWSFARIDGDRQVPDRCSLWVKSGFAAGKLYELTYPGDSAPIVGLGLQAVRDFTSALRGPSPLPARPADARVLVAFGYSQSARFLRDYLYRGFNAGPGGAKVFDGMMVYTAGSGRGSFDHRYALPGQAGNSVMHALRPVDFYPFADVPTPDLDSEPASGLLDRARSQHAVPKIMNVFTSSEYWDRAGSLLHTTIDGRRPVALSPDSRLYFFAGSVHAAQAADDNLKPEFRAELSYNSNDDHAWAGPALLEDMRQWITDGVAPPPSAYPQVGKTLIPPRALRFPRLSGVTVPAEPPPVWQLDFGPDYRTRGVIAREPPRLGARYRLLVPQVDQDGNEMGGWRGLRSSVPLGTYTGWNWLIPGYPGFGVHGELTGAYIPFAKDEAARRAAHDPRPSIAARYGDKAGYMRAVEQAFDRQVAARMLLPSIRAAYLRDMDRQWSITMKLIDRRDAAHPVPVPAPTATPGPPASPKP